jgi:hypothetical protein
MPVMEEKQEAPEPRETATEVRNRYGVLTVISLAFLLWFIYDGWFNESEEMLQHRTFNQVGTFVVAALFLFFATMAGSAALTVMREKKQGPPPDAGQ